MRRHRRCGCECRDDNCSGDIEQITSVCCSECTDFHVPCWYVVHFGCDIIHENQCIARYSDILKKECDFSCDNTCCEWKALGFDAGGSCGGDMFIDPLNTASNNGFDFVTHGCTWSSTEIQRKGTSAVLLVGGNHSSQDGAILTNEFGWSWSLILSGGGATLTYLDIVYSVDSFNCSGANTLTRTSGQTYLPRSVCVTPFWGSNTLPTAWNDIDDRWTTEDEFREAYWKCPCSDAATGTCIWEVQNSPEFGNSWVVRSSGCDGDAACSTPLIPADFDTYGPTSTGYETPCRCSSTGEKYWITKPCDENIPCEYESAEDRCNCCDNCCDGLPVSVVLTCAGTRYSYSGLAEPGGRTGVNSPAGVSREFCFTHDGHEICLVFYCDGTAWQLDSYCDGSYEGPGTVSNHTCCPLRFSFAFPLSCVYCSGCGCAGDTSTCPECEEPDCCCPTYIVPTSLTATLYDSSNVQLCSYPIIKVGDTWSGSATCGSYTVETQMRCQDFGGGSCAYVVSIDCGSGGLSLTQLNQVCEPFYWESTAIGSGFCGVDKVIITE